MSILHRRKRNKERSTGRDQIPAWIELQKLTETEALNLAHSYGLQASNRGDALSALNAKRKAEQ